MRDRPDVLDVLLQRVRVTAGVFGRVELGAPWGARLPAHGSVSMHHVVDGGVWASTAGEEAFAGPGDLLVLPHGGAYALTHERGGSTVDYGPETPHPLTVRRRHGGDGALTVVLCAELTVTGAGRSQLVRALPAVVVLSSVPALRPLLDLLRDELRDPGPGVPSIAARLAELVLLQGIRVASALPAPAGSWRAALTDERIARALDAVYRSPERRWTVTTLARVAGMGRTAFADRFRALFGESPFAA